MVGLHLEQIKRIPMKCQISFHSIVLTLITPGLGKSCFNSDSFCICVMIV